MDMNNLLLFSVLPIVQTSDIAT